MSSGYWREGFVMVQRAVDVALRDYFTGEMTDPLAPAVQVSTFHFPFGYGHAPSHIPR